jgi:Uncharacterized protein conserved in bacteria (DUF2252)
MRSSALRDLAAWQIDRDTIEIPAANLRAEKSRRMQVSPLAFLRGTLPLYQRLLREDPDLSGGITGSGCIVGDAHLANFGAFGVHTDGGASELIFAVNDFDESCDGPWSLDLIRLLASAFMLRTTWQLDARESDRLARCALDGYRAASAPLPACVSALLSRAALQKNVLKGRTDARGRFIRGSRYLDLDPKTRAALPQALATYTDSLPAALRPNLVQMTILDAAFRIAGNGSMGRLRIAVSVQGKRKPWLFDLKEERAPVFAKRKREQPAQQVLEGALKLLGARPKLAGTTTIAGKSMYVRRLTPEDNKLNLDTTPITEREPLCRYLGARLGQAHIQGASKPAKATITDPKATLEQALEVAALTTATYTLWLQKNQPK